MIRAYFRKMAGGASPPPGVDWWEVMWSGLGGFLGISLVALAEACFLQGSDLVLVIGSFGASAVLAFGATQSALAQPRNLVGGHLVSALVGVTAVQLLAPHPWLAAGLAVGGSIALMLATHTLHPPGGATALIAVVGGPKIQALGYLYVLLPVAAGSVLLLLAALVLNNLVPGRRYPAFWW